VAWQIKKVVDELIVPYGGGQLKEKRRVSSRPLEQAEMVRIA